MDDRLHAADRRRLRLRRDFHGNLFSRRKRRTKDYRAKRPQPRRVETHGLFRRCGHNGRTRRQRQLVDRARQIEKPPSNARTADFSTDAAPELDFDLQRQSTIARLERL